jgi:hypothetical protein
LTPPFSPKSRLGQGSAYQANKQSIKLYRALTDWITSEKAVLKGGLKEESKWQMCF